MSETSLGRICVSAFGAVNSMQKVKFPPNADMGVPRFPTVRDRTTVAEAEFREREDLF